MRRFAGSVCRFAGSPVLPVRRFAGSPVRRFAGSPVRRFRRSPPTTLGWRYCIDVSAYYVLLLARHVARCALQADNRRLSSYKSQPKLLLEFSSVLEVRSEGTDRVVDGRPQLRHLAGDRGGWNLIRRYADSPVCRSVVLNVGC